MPGARGRVSVKTNGMKFFCVVPLKALQSLSRKTYLLFTFFRVLGLGSFFRTRKAKDLTSPCKSKNSHIAIPLVFQQMITDGNAASEPPCIYRILFVIHLPTWPSWQTSPKCTKSQVTHTSTSSKTPHYFYEQRQAERLLLPPCSREHSGKPRDTKVTLASQLWLPALAKYWFGL